MVRVKVCGITSLEDAMVCVEAGADALGFIFVEGTPRFVTPERVASIARALPPFVTLVGQSRGRCLRAPSLAVPRR
jgi:phosphoribosylanthranilate isomerase